MISNRLHGFRRVQFDGSRLEDGATAISFKVWTSISKPTGMLEGHSWTVAAVGGGQVDADSVVQTELMALTAKLATILFLVQGAGPEMAVERLAESPIDILAIHRLVEAELWMLNALRHED